MPFPRRPRAVLLDMDGTLLDTETIYVGAMFAALDDMGFRLSDALVHAMIGQPGQECVALLKREFGERFQYPAFQPIYVAHRTERMKAGIPVKPGARDLIALAAARDLPLAVATSSGRANAETNLAAAGLLGHFAAVVTRDDVAAPKPDPAIFRLAAARLGAEPAACLAVEDSHVGVRSAHAAGAMTVMVPDMLKPSEEVAGMCLHVVADLHEVRMLLEQSLEQGEAP
jgi:HAD superfamily hydrolase (TIGR01509 family)